MFYFRKNYQGIRDKIFSKLYSILIGNDKDKKSKINSEFDPEDDFNDIKNLD